MIPDDRIEAEENPVFRVQSTYGRGQGATQIPVAALDPHPNCPGTNQDMIPQTRFFARQLGCCFICGSPHHFAGACPYNGQG